MIDTNRRRCAQAVLGLALGSTTASLFAHGDERHDAPRRRQGAMERMPWGVEGDGASVDHEVEVSMVDTMRFSPSRIDVRVGNTVRFRVRNGGNVLHEFVIGTSAANAEHAALMKRFPEMEHDAAWMTHVPPGRVGEVLWKFDREGEFEFACLISGHYEAGMVGVIKVTPS